MNTEAEIAAKYVAGLIRNKDDEMMVLQTKMNGLREERYYLQYAFTEIQDGFDVTAPNAAASEPIAEQPKADKPKRRRRGRQKKSHAQLIIEAMEAFMSKVGRPIYRQYIFNAVLATDGIYMDVADPVRSLSWYLTSCDQFINTHRGEGIWSLPEYADRPPIRKGEWNEMEGSREEETLPDVVQLNVYQQETIQGRNNV